MLAGVNLFVQCASFFRTKTVDSVRSSRLRVPTNEYPSLRSSSSMEFVLQRLTAAHKLRRAYVVLYSFAGPSAWNILPGELPAAVADREEFRK